MQNPHPRDPLTEAARAHQEGRLDQAAFGYREVLRREPRRIDALRLFGILLFQRGETTEGIRFLRKAVKHGATDLAAHMDLATALARSSDREEVVRILKKATAIAPKSAQTWTAYGIALLELDRAAESSAALQRAVCLEPGTVDAWIALGNALRSQGLLDEAMAAFEEAARLRPRFAKIYTNIGNLASELGDFDRALASHRKAIGLSPNMVEALLNLGNTLNMARKYGKAAATYLEALARDPNSVVALSGLGGALSKLGQNEQALDAFERARRLRPDDANITLQSLLLRRALGRNETPEELASLVAEPSRASALATIAGAFETQNDRAAARRAVELALQRDPDHLMANIIAARLERREDQALARDRLLKVMPKHKELNSAFFTVLGHTHDRLGSYDEAFAAFTKAKLAAAAALGGTTESWKKHYLEHVQSYQDWYSEERAKAWPPPDQGADVPNPVFFVGFPRSGTTLFEQMMDSHPNLATTGETQILSRLRMLVPSLIGRKDEPLRLLDSLSPDEVTKLARWYLAEVEPFRTAKAGAKRVVDKMPLNIVEVGFIRRVFPQAPVIVALRDPRDVILSCFMQNFQINRAMPHFLTLEGTARLYASVMGLWLHYRKDSGLRAFEYRYEDLVADTEGIARKAFAFLNEPWNDQVLAYQARASERFVSTHSYADVTSPIYTRSIARWRRYEKHLEPVLPIVEPFVQAFGYSDR